jgi:hypothetical protein
MILQGINTCIKGNVNCTEACYLFGGSSSLCTGAHCFSQLVVDGDIAGTVSVNPFIYSQQSDEVVLVANVSEQGGCDHFDHSESFRCMMVMLPTLPWKLSHSPAQCKNKK